MKKYLPIIVAVVVGALAMSYFGGSNTLGGSTRGTQTFTNAQASSTVYTVGHQLSTQVLAESGIRLYAEICNNNPSNRAYIAFTDSAITATTSASIPLQIGTNGSNCYRIIPDENLHTDIVHVITDTASSTDLFVTEFRRR